MKIYSVYDSEFAPYGRVMEGYDTAALCKAMRRFPLPESGTAYEPSLLELESAGLYSALRDSAFGGMPVQIGMCLGRNTCLNCLEYHRDSELNVGEGDFILLLARRDELGSGFTLDTGKVKAFRVPAGALVEVYATTLHYAPCHVDARRASAWPWCCRGGPTARGRRSQRLRRRTSCCGRATSGLSPIPRAPRLRTVRLPA